MPELWITLIIVGLITFAFRLSFIALFERMNVPPLLQRALRFVPVAALTAIIVPELLIRDGALYLSLANARLLAGALAVVVAWRTKNVLLTIAIGMVALWVLQAVLR